MTRRVAGRGLEAEVLPEGVMAVHDVRPACFHDRHDAVGDAAVGLGASLVLVLPELPFLADEDVGRLRERGDPSTVHAPRVPAHVIDMQMRAHDDVDVLRRGACPPQILEVAALSSVAGGKAGALLVVAEASIDEDRLFRRANDVRLDAGAQIAHRVVPEMGPEPAMMARDGLGPGVRKHRGRGQRRTVDFHHACDRHLAELNGLHGLLTRPGRRGGASRASRARPRERRRSCGRA